MEQHQCTLDEALIAVEVSNKLAIELARRLAEINAEIAQLKLESVKLPGPQPVRGDV